MGLIRRLQVTQKIMERTMLGAIESKMKRPLKSKDLVLFALHCPSSLLIPLAQQDAASTPNTNNLMVSGPNQNEQTNPNISNATEVIQQIDVKDGENQVSSNINNVVVIDENDLNDNNGTQNNGTNNLVVNNAVEQTGNASSIVNTTSVNPLNSTSFLLMTNSLNGTSGNTLNADNIAIHGLQNKLANETQTNPLNTTYNADVSILHETLNDAEVELAWRSDFPVGKNKTKNLKHTAKLDSQNATLLANNINSNKNNSKSQLLDSEDDEEKSIFVILNSGNIDGLSVNSPANNSKLQTNLEHNAIENLNSSNSKLLNDLINTTINDVLSKILQQNHSNLNSTHIFLLLNSGNISNVHVNSPVLENVVKNTTLKDRSRRHLNESDTNNSSVESVTLKSSSPIIDVKFRTGEHQGLQNNVITDNHTGNIPLDSNQNNTNLVSNVPANDTLPNSNATAVEIPTEDISSAEVPTFRSLIPDKIRKLQQVSNVVTNAINETVDHNLVLKLSPESPPLSIDLDQIPINNLLGGAMSFLKRLKRNTNDKAKSNYPRKTNYKSKQIDKHHTVTSCNKSKLNNNDLTTQTRRSFDNDISNELKLDSLDLICPLSVIVKLYTHQVLDNIAKNDPDGVLNKILTSFLEGNKDAIELVSTEILHLPTPIKIRLQLIHGNTKEFMEKLSDIVDATLCSLS